MMVEYSHIKNKSDIIKINKYIIRDIRAAKTQDELTQLHRRSIFLVTLTYSPGWKEKYAGQIQQMRKTAKKYFTIVTKHINHKSAMLKLQHKYDQTYGG